MTAFRILPGLPPYGPPAEPFSASGLGMHREGLVVEFTPTDGKTWVGNFQRGMNRADHIAREPGTEHVVVIAGGQAYVVDPDTHRCERTFGGRIQETLTLADGSLLFSNGLWLEALGAAGLRWRSRRISWDGFYSLEVHGDRITGEAWNAMEDTWTPFSVSLATGEVEGGSYPSEFPSD